MLALILPESIKRISSIVVIGPPFVMCSVNGALLFHVVSEICNLCTPWKYIDA